MCERLDGLSVCVVACHYQPETTGSAPYNTMLAHTLAQAGAHVEIVAGIPHYPQWRVQDDRYRFGIRWRERNDEIMVTRVRHAVPAHANLLGRARLEGSFAALAAPYVAASRAHVVVAVTPLLGAVLAAHVGRRGRPVGVIVHDLSGNGAEQSGTANSRAARAVTAIEYGLLASATRVGVITPRFTPTLTSNGISSDAISVLPIFSHAGAAALTPAEARSQLGWPDAAMTVVHTGNMGMKQGLEHAINAARAAEQNGMSVEFVFVGDGNQRARLQADAAGLDNVRFVAPVSDEEYPLVLAAADVLLLHEKPGVTEMSLPSKLTSYVTAGRPILAAVEDGGITKALLDTHGSALTTPCGDTDAMLASLRRLSEDSLLTEGLVERAARMGTAEFSPELGKAAFREFVTELIR